MSDSVSRQGVLKILTDISYNHCPTAQASEAVDLAKTMVAVMPDAEPERKTGWILCSERLPDKDGSYIVTENSGGTTSTGISFFIICDDGRTWWELFGVVAWMPLPEPYREEGNG